MPWRPGGGRCGARRAWRRSTGLRLAEPGEFTRRAFDNGRIDLTEAEGLADLLEAETESQRRAALALAEGGLRRADRAVAGAAARLSARAEAAIDYVDEEDETRPIRRSARDARRLADELQRMARAAARRAAARTASGSSSRARRTPENPALSMR